MALAGWSVRTSRHGRAGRVHGRITLLNWESCTSFQPAELYNGGDGAAVNFPAGSLLDDNRLELRRTDANNDQTWNYLDYWRFETLWTGSNYDSGMVVIIQ